MQETRKPLPVQLLRTGLPLAWLTLHCLLLFSFGIVTTGEAEKYLSEADRILRGEGFSSGKFLFYSAYIYLLAFMQATGLGITGVFLLQLALNGLSTYGFFRASEHLFPGSKTAWFTTTLLVACIPLQAWTTHLYTESVFVSVSILFLCNYLQRGIRHPGSIALLLLLPLIRPTGMLFILAVLFHQLYRSFGKPGFRKIAGLYLAGFLAALLAINYALRSGGEFDFLLPLREAHIICGVPAGLDNGNLKLPANPNSLQGILTFAWQNPVYFMDLATRRLVSFLGMVRPYYSTGHNWMLGLFFYPLYLLAIFGQTRAWKINRSFGVLAISCLLLFSFSVILTCDDWLNRFMMPLIPLLIWISGFALVPIKRMHNFLPH